MARLRVKKPLHLLRDYRLVRRSGLFDPSFYPIIDNDHIDSLDPLVHYLAVGFKEDCNPNQLFDNRYYQRSNPDALSRDINPLVHYIIVGAQAGQKPHPLFDTKYYLQHDHAILPERMNPLRHFLLFGAEERRNPHPLFDTGYYLEEYPDVAVSGVNPLVHYLHKGAEENRDPHPLFSTSYYYEKNQTVRDEKQNPLVHYLEEGALQGCKPHPLFDTAYYLSMYRDVSESQMNPLVHYLLFGVREGCRPNPLFNTRYYLEKNPDIQIRGINPLVHYLKEGYREHRNPSIRFNTDYYLSSNRDVADLDIHPLIHYLEHGSREGRYPANIYELWLPHHMVTDAGRKKMKDKIDHFSYYPLISVIVPVYNTDEQWLMRCVESVRRQLYPFWELCIADDASTKPHVPRILKEYMAKDARIKVAFRDKNGHISACSNTALELATGEYIALLDHDDELSEDALYENASLLNAHPDADMIYSDEDKINEEGERFDPFFKPDWSPDTFLSQKYTCHLGIYRTKLISDIGGFREGFEGSQDYDLVLRLMEQTQKIYHIPKILYHGRMPPGSTALAADPKNYAHKAGLKALRDALARRGEERRVEEVQSYPGHFIVRYPIRKNPLPLISILIPTRDNADCLDACLDSIFAKNTYPHYEIMVLDNGSIQQKTRTALADWQRKEPSKIRVIPLDMPFNYARLNNLGAKSARGDLLLLLNDDVTVITPDWLQEMAGQALRSNIGAVGAHLLYPDETIQHAGIILGIGGIANHGHRRAGADNPGYFGRLLAVTNYAAVTGACLMVKKNLYLSMGGLDEALAVSYNDVDFCLRLLCKGYFNVTLPQVRLYHMESKSRGKDDDNDAEKRQRFQQEADIMLKRWGDLIKRDPFYNPNLTRQREDFTINLEGIDS